MYVTTQVPIYVPNLGTVHVAGEVNAKFWYNPEATTVVFDVVSIDGQKIKAEHWLPHNDTLCDLLSRCASAELVAEAPIDEPFGMLDFYRAELRREKIDKVLALCS